MKRLQLDVQKRELVGKKVKRLRREGLLPANIYGKDVKSISVQVPVKDFDKVYKEVHETGLLDVALGTDIRPVLIHNVQLDPRTSLPVHADFYQVNLKEKVKTMVPIEPTGEPKAVTDKLGLLMQPLNEVEVEALPEDLPEKIEVNVEALLAIDEQITVADLKVSQAVTILTDPGQVVFKIGALISKEAEELAKEEATKAEEAKAEAGAAEAAEIPTEGAPAPEGAAEQPTDEAKPQTDRNAEPRDADGGESKPK